MWLHPRGLLAAKTAVAAALAWLCVQPLGGFLDEYPYYAPLGAISAMYPTVLGSVRAGLQTVAGIALGILLAAGVLLVGEPNLVTVAVAVGLGDHLVGARLCREPDYLKLVPRGFDHLERLHADRAGGAEHDHTLHGAEGTQTALAPSTPRRK